MCLHWIQLESLSSLLNGVAHSGALSSQFLVLATHYPLLTVAGADYSREHRLHGAENNEDLLLALRRARRRPNLVLHGHVHRGYRATLDFHLDALNPLAADDCA